MNDRCTLAIEVDEGRAVVGSSSENIRRTMQNVCKTEQWSTQQSQKQYYYILLSTEPLPDDEDDRSGQEVACKL